MIEIALYIGFVAVSASFMWWRFYISVRDQVATVKWAKYRRSDEPVTYWLSTSMMAVGALLTSFLALVIAVGLFFAGLVG